MGEVALLGSYIRNGLRAQMLYPTAFLLRLVTQFTMTIVEFGGLYAMFVRFGHVRGWTFAEVALFYGIISTAFSLIDMSTRGFDLFGPQFVKTGDFDRVLLRPRPATTQLMGFDFGFTSLGRLAQGLVATAIAIALLHIDWTAAKVALLLWSVAGGAALFFGFLVLQATLAFWTVESLEIVNTITYGGVEAAQYPLDIYAAWFRKFLIYVVPLGCVVYFPVAAALGRSEMTGGPAWLGVLTPLAGFAFLAVAFAAWRRGIAHYTSTGS
ncbi:MAG: ABC-2 family transporter protein [Alphaproteobacteria bacterium]|nr:ABC-2 family transporter protein [Alphaproteobacteria bacterium]MBV9540034.1 ABC-2 family transporter protein [Alphaproteobacteria bacterium]MBV9904923.1 ABC-2 family transporter protein [Alphaproteobacteria bacterium]